MVRIGGFEGFDENIIETNTPLKPTKVGLIFIGPNSLSRA